jgi:hypothetical protein
MSPLGSQKSEKQLKTSPNQTEGIKTEIAIDYLGPALHQERDIEGKSGQFVVRHRISQRNNSAEQVEIGALEGEEGGA